MSIFKGGNLREQLDQGWTDISPKTTHYTGQ